MVRSASTIEEVSRLARVHPSTASRVLRGVKSQSVSEATRERILEAARALDYRPNAMARALRLRKTSTIALLSPYLDSLGFNEIARGIHDEAARREHAVLTAVVETASGEDSPHDLAAGGRVDGLIAAFGLRRDARVQLLADTGVPLVTVNRRVIGVSRSVVVEDALASRLAVEHLRLLGHSRIGHIAGQEETDTAFRRAAGFRSAMRDSGGTIPRGGVVSGLYSIEGGFAAATAILTLPAPRRPTALVVADPLSALGAMKAIRLLGLSIPGDVALVALNDHMIADHVEPALTTVRLPYLELGRAAVSMLIDVIEHREPSPKVVKDPAPRVVVRGSTAPPSN